MKKYHGAKGKGLSALTWFFARPLDKKITKSFWRLTIPVTIEGFLEVVAYAMLGIMIGWFGTNELAARQISNGFLEMFYMIPMSMTYATTIMISHMVGKKQFSKLRVAGLASLLTVGVFSLGAILFLLLLGEDIAIAFGKDLSAADAIINLALGFLLIGAISQMADGVQSVMLGALRGIGDFTVSSIISIAGYCGLGIPLGYILGFHVFHHPLGVIAGFIIGVLVAGVLLSLRFWHKTNFARA